MDLRAGHPCFSNTFSSFSYFYGVEIYHSICLQHFGIGVPILCYLKLKQFSFLIIETLHSNCTCTYLRFAPIFSRFIQYVGHAGSDPNSVLVCFFPFLSCLRQMSLKRDYAILLSIVGVVNILLKFFETLITLSNVHRIS